MNEISWVSEIIPELIWIALLLKDKDQKEAVRLARTFAGVFNNNLELSEGVMPGQMSIFTKLNEDQKNTIREKLLHSGDLFELQDNLKVLKVYYPNCPLNFLFTSTPDDTQRQALDNLKKTLEELFDKQSKLSVFTRATLISIAFDSGQFKVFKDSELTQLHEIENYPLTEESKRVDASVRSSINFIISQGLDRKFNWPVYFWNTGLKIEKCDIPSQDD